MSELPRFVPWISGQFSPLTIITLIPQPHFLKVRPLTHMSREFSLSYLQPCLDLEPGGVAVPQVVQVDRECGNGTAGPNGPTCPQNNTVMEDIFT